MNPLLERGNTRLAPLDTVDKSKICEYFHTMLYYADGKLFWKMRPIEHFKSEAYQRRWNSKMSGKEAGSNSHGYIVIRINDKPIMAHRVVFCMFFGYLPDQVDHINTNKSDNRPHNLRSATVAENNRNRGAQRNSSTGIKGVSINKETGKYFARIGFEKKYYHLGTFETPELASMAYKIAAEKYHGKFAREA